MLYIKYNAQLVDLFYSDGRVVYVFNKKDTCELYQKWKNHELY